MALADTQPREMTGGTNTLTQCRYMDAVSLTLLNTAKEARCTVYDGVDATGPILANLAVSANHPFSVAPLQVAGVSGTLYVTIFDVGAAANANSIARVMLYAVR